MRMRAMICVFFAVLLLILVTAFHWMVEARQAAVQSIHNFVLIDAGHGGVDGGASAPDGTLEKTINLAVSLHLRDMLTLFGVPTAMVRDSDMSIHDVGCETIRQKKVSDMKNRLKQYDAAALTVSIHQNHYAVSKYSGTQLIYSANHPSSLPLAQAVREKVVAYLQPTNKREMKAATNDIYLLHHTKRPAILVECGFLSNPIDSENLKTAAYQQRFAFVVAAGILDVKQGVS